MFFEVLIISGMAITTFAIRYVFFGASDRIQLSPAIIKALGYVPPVVLTAIVIPEVFFQEGILSISYENARLVGAIAAGTNRAFTQNLLLTIVGGMCAFFVWQGILATIS